MEWRSLMCPRITRISRIGKDDAVGRVVRSVSHGGAGPRRSRQQNSGDNLIDYECSNRIFGRSSDRDWLIVIPLNYCRLPCQRFSFCIFQFPLINHHYRPPPSTSSPSVFVLKPTRAKPARHASRFRGLPCHSVAQVPDNLSLIHTPRVAFAAAG